MGRPQLRRVGVYDIDGTMMTKRMETEGATASELSSAHFVRDYYSTDGTFTVATAQTAEMLMSSASYDASVRHQGFSRPKPLLGGMKGARSYVRPEQIACRVPFLDAEAIMSMGTGCRFRQPDGSYRENLSYKRRLGPNWRTNAFSLLEILSDKGLKEFIPYLADIEFEENYYQQKADVAPLEYRIQFEFPDRETKDRLKNLIQTALLGLRELCRLSNITSAHLTSIKEEFGDILSNLNIVDESNPSVGKYQFYLMPRYASKEEMIDETLALLSQGEIIEDLLIAGDMPPDLRAGCYAGRALQATFLLVGGSPVSPYLDRERDEFGKPYAGESLGFITENLIRTSRSGFDVLSRAGVPFRMIVNGSVAYPGTVGPETIAAFLKDEKKPVVQ